MTWTSDANASADSPKRGKGYASQKPNLPRSLDRRFPEPLRRRVGCQSVSCGAATRNGLAARADYIRGLARSRSRAGSEAYPARDGDRVEPAAGFAARPTAPNPLPGGIASNWEPIKRAGAEPHRTDMTRSFGAAFDGRRRQGGH